LFAPLTKEFSFLSTTRNQAAIDCLIGLLDSPDSAVRWQAGLALSARTDKVSLEKFLEAFDVSRPFCRREWKTLGYRLVGTIMQVLEDPRHRLYRSALKAIADCEIPEGLSRLVRATEQTSSAHGAFAGKQLVQLALHLGKEFRRGGIESAIRASLLKMLAGSLNEFAVHRSSTIAEAFLACVDADDAWFATILNDPNQSVLKILIRQWKSTQRIEILELLASLLGKHFVPKGVCEILFKDRKDIKMAVALANVAKHGLAPTALNRLVQNGVPECCMNLKPDDSLIDEQDRWTLWTLIAAGKAPLTRLFEGLRWFVENSSIESQLAIANILRHYPPTSCLEFLEAMAPEAMSKGEDIDAAKADDLPDDGSQFRADLRKLLGILPTSDPNLRNAIESFFGEFNIETLIQHLDVLMDDAIVCFAEIMRAIHPNWPQTLIPILESPVGERRCNAAVAASYLGAHSDLKLSLNKLLQDEFEMVREEAEYALKDYPSVPVPSNVAALVSTDHDVSRAL